MPLIWKVLPNMPSGKSDLAASRQWPLQSLTSFFLGLQATPPGMSAVHMLIFRTVCGLSGCLLSAHVSAGRRELPHEMVDYTDWSVTVS